MGIDLGSMHKGYQTVLIGDPKNYLLKSHDPLKVFDHIDVKKLC
jgi:hypothetical protein